MTITLSQTGVTYSGPEATQLYAMMAVHRAMLLHVKTGMQVNKAYTPRAMRDFAARHTGKKYKTNELSVAANDLGERIEQIKRGMKVVDER